MADDFYLVHKSILPAGIDKIIECRNLVENQGFKVTDACKIVGISRNKYYNYKDLVFPAKKENSRKIKLIIKLKDERGSLSDVLSIVSKANGNVITINQDAPIDGSANISLTIDAKDMILSIEELIKSISEKEGASAVKLLAVE